jgi:membrane protease YdiL (CAAX protease family)
MLAINNLLTNNQIKSYFLLTFLISWGAILCIVGPNGGLPATSEEAKQAIGLGLLLGPSFAAFALTAVLKGKEGLRELLLPTDVNPCQNQNKGCSYYALAILIAPLSSMITLLILSTFVSEAYTPKLLTSTDKTSLVITGISVGLVIGTLEEVGWSGYAVPRLLQSSYTGQELLREHYGASGTSHRFGKLTPSRLGYLFCCYLEDYSHG